MAEPLSVQLVDEILVALTSVVRLTLPADRWDAVGESVRRIDDAVWANDEKAARTQLKMLRGAVVGTAPRPLPGEAAAPVVNPLSYRTTDYVTRTSLGTITTVLVGAGVLLATLIVLVMVVLAVGPERDGTQAESPTTVSAPAGTSDPAPSDGSNIYQLSAGVLVLGGVAVFAAMIWRRRVRGAAASARARCEDEPDSDVMVLSGGNREPPPADLVDAVDRVVNVLWERQDGPDAPTND